MLTLGLIQADAGLLRHRCAVVNWLAAAYRTVQVTVRHTGHLGATLPKRLATGEVVSVGTSDISHIGNAIDVTARGSGAVVAVITVAVILLSTSVRLGLVVVIGVPVLMAIVGGLIRPLHRHQQAYREQSGSPHHPGQRHRHRPAGAARRRRRVDVLRPLPGRVPAGTGRGCPGGAGRVAAGRRADPAARHLRGPGDLAGRAGGA